MERIGVSMKRSAALFLKAVSWELFDHPLEPHPFSIIARDKDLFDEKNGVGKEEKIVELKKF